ncbi:MAG: hypothetical protein IK083_09555 [Abditibacteriota bacterium]|nr:hypothetical protein [Abditibacteriota bacterium]
MKPNDTYGPTLGISPLKDGKAPAPAKANNTVWANNPEKDNEQMSARDDEQIKEARKGKTSSVTKYYAEELKSGVHTLDDQREHSLFVESLIKGLALTKIYIKAENADKIDDIKIPKEEMPEGWDDSTKTKVWAHFKDLVKESEAFNNSNEVAFTLNKNADFHESFYGDENSVTICTSESTIYVLHNHPNGSSFSPDDFRVFTESNSVKNFSLITNTCRRIEILTKLDGFDESLFKSIVNNAEFTRPENAISYIKQKLLEEPVGVKWSVYYEQENDNHK